MWRSVATKSINCSLNKFKLKKCTSLTSRQRKDHVSLPAAVHLFNISKKKPHTSSAKSSDTSTSNKISKDLIIPLDGNDPLLLSFGKLARFADGSCVASIGGTSVLVTAVSKKVNVNNDGDNIKLVAPASFVPLTVDYRQKAAAAGRIPTNHLRRELGPTDNEILIGRVIDRSIRPQFPKGYGAETQIVCNLLSTDGIHDPSVVALNGASAALSMSDIPWNGPIGAARVGYIDSTFILNPTRKQSKKLLTRSKNALNLLLAGTKDGMVVMLEADSANLDPKLVLDGIEFGLNSTSKIADNIHTEAVSSAITKRLNPYNFHKQDDSNKDKDLQSPQCQAFSIIEMMCEQKLRMIYANKSHDKTSRDIEAFAVRDKAIAELRAKQDITVDPSFYYDAFTLLSRKIIASLALDESLRVDGRTIEEIRPITCQVDTHPPLHGSALFQRGQTQVFCTVALDSLESTALKVDPVSALMGGTKEKNFFLHYEFPPYATNEIGRSGAAAGRRELGHGALAEKALKEVVPKDHPFTIRLTSEVLESNGSSSMASICGGSLALLDAGVPLISPAAGVAMGLVSREMSNSDENSHTSAENSFNREYVVLTDILGMEDYLGDMDFKVAGTRSGITALQADIKLPGIPFDVVQTAMTKGHSAISNILDIMENSREDKNEPRANKVNWPVKEKIDVPAHKRGRFLGPGGMNLKKILAETGVQINPESGTEASTTWTLFAPNSEAMSEANEIIESILEEEKVPDLEFGSIYPSIIREIKERGVMVEIHPAMPLVFVTNSQLDAKKVS